MTDTLPALLVRQSRERGDAVALREKEFGIWQSYSWNDYLERVRCFSLGLVALGLERGETVAIVGDNRPEWVIAQLAAISAGGVSMGIYQDCVAAEVQFLAQFAKILYQVIGE